MAYVYIGRFGDAYAPIIQNSGATAGEAMELSPSLFGARATAEALAAEYGGSAAVLRPAWCLGNTTNLAQATEVFEEAWDIPSLKVTP